MKSSLVSAVAIGLICSNVYALDNQKQLPQQLLGNQTQMQSLADINKAKGEAFLAKNKNNPGVITLADGLQYRIIIDGKGEKPSLNDSVTVHYAGTLIDGTEFDSSYKRNVPATFPLTAVIAGWTEALQLMKVGSTWELYIPAQLAYGARGPGSIGPNQTLIFKVELLGIKKSQF